MPPKQKQEDINMQDLLKAIDNRLAPVLEKMDTIDKKLEPILEAMKDIQLIKTEIKELKETSHELEKSVIDTSDKMEAMLNNTYPNLKAEINNIAEALALQTLDIEVHRRKWNLVVQGIKGTAKEEEDITRGKLVNFARDSLRVTDAANNRFSACHRLRREPDAGIIVRFCDLSERDKWLKNGKFLKDSKDSHVSVSPDLPHVLRPLKSEVMEYRRRLEPSVKSRAKVLYRPSWPYIELIHPAPDNPDRIIKYCPSATKAQLLSQITEWKHRAPPAH